MSRTLPLLYVALATSAALFGQSPQGAAQSASDGTAVPSPMILTAKFVHINELLWANGAWFTTDEFLRLSKFTCDGVSLSGAVDVRGKTTKAGLDLVAEVTPAGDAEVKVRVRFWNPPRNKDRFVTAVIELFLGDTPIPEDRPVWRATVGPLNVEEGHTPQHGQTSFRAPLELLRRPLSVRLTVTVKK